MDEDIYVWTGTATQYKINLLRKFFEHYHQDSEDLVFYIDDTKDTGTDEEAERYKLRRRYWEKALPAIQAETGTFRYVTSTKNNTISGSTEKAGVALCCVANFDSARVEIYIDQGDYDKTKAFYKSIEAHRVEIETAYGKSLTWVNSEDTRSCRVYDEIKDVSIKNEDDWHEMITFHSQQARHLLHSMQPYLG